MSILKINHLSKSYKTGEEAIAVLQDISGSINQGEMVAVMGPSGSGKSTLLQIISGIDIPDSGDIFVKNKNISVLGTEEMAQFRRKHIGMVFQDFQLLDSLNVQENILLPLVIDEMDYELQEQRLQYILDVLEIKCLKNKRLNEISGGQKQKIAIGRALIQNPDIVFADEPTGSLDMRSTKIVMECMKKMLLANIRSYFIFIGGNLLAVSLFFAFVSLYTNRSFMNETIVDPMISSNILFAGVLVTLFFVVMIFISARVFWKEQKKEYAVMTVLGMSIKKAVKSIVCKNVFVAAVTIPTALLIGTILSFGFYIVIRYVIGIEGIIWLDNGNGYILTVVSYSILSLLSIACNMLIHTKEHLIFQLKAVGLERDGMFVRLIKNKFPKVWNYFLPNVVFVRLHRRMWSVRYGIESILICGMMVLIGICVSLYPSFKENADMYSPYDMLYIETYGVNQVAQGDIARILNENNVELTEYKQLEFVRNTAFNFVPVSEVNEIFYYNYEVQEGECINLFQIDEMDGYEHNVTPIEEVTVTDRVQLTSIGKDIRILWNQNPAFADRTLIVSDSDYYHIKYAEDCYGGKINLYKFSNWKSSMAAVKRVEEYLQQTNGLKKEEQYNYRVSSHVNQYQQAKQSGQFLIFVMSFVLLVLWIAAMSISFLGVRAERDEHRRMAGSLYRIGITAEQITKYMAFRNRIRYVFPVVIGEAFGFVLVMLWNKAAYQMRFTVVMVEMVIAGLILSGIWVVSGKMNRKIND